MPTSFVIIFLFILLFIVFLRPALKSGCRRFAVFFCVCYVLSLIILLAHSSGAHLAGPSEWIMNLAGLWGL